MMRVDANLTLDRYRWAEQRIAEWHKRAPVPLVSDIGAGDGRMRQAAERLGLPWQGFDLFPQSADILRWDLDDAAPATAQPPGLVLMLDVLEHLRNPWRGLAHVSQHLLPGGFLILTMPNPRWSRSRFVALARGWPACFTDSDLELNHHVFTPWQHIVERLLRDTGFRVCQYVTLDGSTSWPGRPYNLRYPVRVAFAALNKLVERRDASACGMSYGLVAEKEAAPCPR
jgi:SAM-dependent methyltransferase